MRLKDEFKVDQGYKIDPRRLQIEPGWNARHDTPALRQANAELKESIRALGVQEALTAYVDGETIIVTNGHRRLSMTMELIAEGEPIQTVPVRLESGSNDAARCLSMLTRNSGLRLDPLETAEVIQRLINFGWDAAQVSAKTGFSRASVFESLALLAAPAQVLGMVKRGEVSASLAVQTVKDEGRNASSVLQEAGRIAEASHAPRVAPRHVKAVQAARAEASPEVPAEPPARRRYVNWSEVGPKQSKFAQRIFDAAPGPERDKAVQKAYEFHKTTFGE